MSKTTIAVTNDDKESLLEASEELFGTKKVPHAVIVRKLISEACDDVEITFED